MKILMSHNGMYKRNGWGRTFELGRGLVRLNNEVIIICSGRGKLKLYESFVEEGVKVYVLYDIVPLGVLGSGYGFISLLCRIMYVLFHKFDIVHADAHRLASYLPCAINRYIYNSKLVIEWWDNFEEKAKEIYLKNFFRRKLREIDLKNEITTKINADGCVVLSKLLYDRALNLHIPKNRIKLIYGGCDVEHIRYNPLGVNKKMLGLLDTTLTFGFIGMGDAEYSDMRAFLEAICEVVVDVDVRIVNFGRPFIQSLEKLPQLRSIIIECGWLDYYKDTSLLSAVDVFVLLKVDNKVNNSGWPTKLGDYLATGRNILANLYGDVFSFVKENGVFVIETDNTEEDIKNKIVNIANNRTWLEEGKYNRQVAEKYSWDVRANELLSFYRYCIDS